MPQTMRQVREQAAVRERILGAARELFVRHGYEHVSLRKIADSIGYTAPALYTHFADKNALLVALCREDFQGMMQSMRRLGRIADPLERILRTGAAYVRFAVEHPKHYRLMFMTPPPPGVEPQEEDLAKMGDPEVDGYAFLREAVREAMGRGAFRPEYKDEELITQVLWAGVHGVASLQITHEHDPWVSWRGLDRRVRTMTEGLLRGLITERAAREAGL
jgi:AcrR family transcriptional regulator